MNFANFNVTFEWLFKNFPCSNYAASVPLDYVHFCLSTRHEATSLRTGLHSGYGQSAHRRRPHAARTVGIKFWTSSCWEAKASVEKRFSDAYFLLKAIPVMVDISIIRAPDWYDPCWVFLSVGRLIWMRLRDLIENFKIRANLLTVSMEYRIFILC